MVFKSKPRPSSPRPKTPQTQGEMFPSPSTREKELEIEIRDLKTLMKAVASDAYDMGAQDGADSVTKMGRATFLRNEKAKAMKRLLGDQES